MPDAPHDSDAAPHVFDQTNGVLGEDTDEDRPDRRPESGGPKFGIPPLTSL